MIPKWKIHQFIQIIRPEETSELEEIALMHIVGFALTEVLTHSHAQTKTLQNE